MVTTLIDTPRDGTRTAVRTIIVVIGVLTVALWVMVGVSVITSRKVALQNATSEGHNLMIAFREEVAHILYRIETVTTLLTAKMRRDQDFDLYTWGHEGGLTDAEIAEIGLIDPDGILRHTTLEPHPGLIELGDRKHFEIHLDGQFHGLYIGQPIKSRLTGLLSLPVSLRVDAADGTFLGVLVVLISPSELTRLPRSIDLGPHGLMTLSGLDNIIRARFSANSPDGSAGVGRSIAGGPRPVEIADDATGWFVRSGALDGISRLHAYGRIGNYPLVVTVGLELKQVLAEWHSQATIIIIMAIGATLLLLGLAAYLIREIYGGATRARTAARNITYAAEHDFLTGLPNRLLLSDRIGQAIAFAQRHQKSVAVLFLDLDGFKHINDSLVVRV